jgi:hypothetical protein
MENEELNAEQIAAALELLFAGMDPAEEWIADSHQDGNASVVKMPVEYSDEFPTDIESNSGVVIHSEGIVSMERAQYFALLSPKNMGKLLPVIRAGIIARQPQERADLTDMEENIIIDRSILEAACREIREWKVDKGGDDQVVLNIEATLRRSANTADGNPLLAWAVGEWNAQVKNRPLQNVHRRALDTVWRQVIRWAGGDPYELVGSPHAVLAEADGLTPKEPDPLLYPETLTPELHDALGTMVFQAGPLATILRKGGFEIPTRGEDEQAHVLHLFIRLVLLHGENWRGEVSKILTGIVAKVKEAEGKTDV